MARSMMSMLMLLSRAFWIARRRREFPAASGPPPCLTAIVISRPRLVKRAPFLTSATPFARLICFHFECPAINGYLLRKKESKLQGHFSTSVRKPSGTSQSPRLSGLGNALADARIGGKSGAQSYVVDQPGLADAHRKRDER